MNIKKIINQRYWLDYWKADKNKGCFAAHLQMTISEDLLQGYWKITLIYGAGRHQFQAKMDYLDEKEFICLLQVNVERFYARWTNSKAPPDLFITTSVPQNFAIEPALNTLTLDMISD